jgi:hypothetical protein
MAHSRQGLFSKKSQAYQQRFKKMMAGIAGVFDLKNLRVQPHAGEAGTLEWRLAFYYDSRSEGHSELRPISPWHDIPLYSKEGNVHFVCEIPMWTRAKMEMGTRTAAHTRLRTPSCALCASQSARLAVARPGPSVDSAPGRAARVRELVGGRAVGCGSGCRSRPGAQVSERRPTLTRVRSPLRACLCHSSRESCSLPDWTPAIRLSLLHLTVQSHCLPSPWLPTCLRDTHLRPSLSRHTRSQPAAATGEEFNPIKAASRSGKPMKYTYGDLLFNYGALPQTWNVRGCATSLGCPHSLSVAASDH